MTRCPLAALMVLALVGRPWPARGAIVTIPGAGGDSCGVIIRRAGPDDVLLRERNPLLGASERANHALGPGSLRAVVGKDSLRRPHIFIVDTTTNTRRRLCSGSAPRFSPDGRWIACSRWLSRERPYVLSLVEVRTSRIHVLEDVGQIVDYAWSQDSRRLAFTSMPDDTTHAWHIGWIDAARRSVHVLAGDGDPHAEYYDCEWASDSRRFVVGRVRSYEHDDVFAHDLWLFDVARRPCRLTHTPERGEYLPGWIDDRRIRFEDHDLEEGRSRHVVELRPARRRR